MLAVPNCFYATSPARPPLELSVHESPPRGTDRVVSVSLVSQRGVWPPIQFPNWSSGRETPPLRHLMTGGGAAGKFLGCPWNGESLHEGLDWFPTLVAAAGNPNIGEELKKGTKLGDQTYKVHLDGYNQIGLFTGKGPSTRHEVFYFTEGTLSAVRIDDFKYRFTDQPGGWMGSTVKTDWPILTNLRLDPFERSGLPNGVGGSLAYYNWFAFEFWRFQYVQKEVAKLAQTAIEFPPLQKGGSFNLEGVKAQTEKASGGPAGK